VVNEAATVQAFLRVRGEAHPDRSAARKREQAADAREEFAVHHGVDPQAAHTPAKNQDVTQQAQARAVIQGVQTRLLCQRQQPRNLLVFLELQHMDLRSGETPAQLRKHGPGQHDAAHLGQQNDHDVAGLRW
jgi:hypothetical protein